MPKNHNRLPIDQVNAGNFTVPEGEERLYHVKIEIPQYDAATGQKISVPRIQTFNHKMYPLLVNNLKQIGYKLEVLHDPTEFLKSQKETKKVSKEDRMKARIIEDLRAQGIIKDPNAKTEEQLRAEIIAELKEKGMYQDPAPKTPKSKTTKKAEEPKPVEEPKPAEKPAEGESVEESLD